MATASTFETYSSVEDFEPKATTEAAPKLSMPAPVSDTAKGYHEISARRSTRTHPLAALFVAAVGILLGLSAGSWITVRSLSPTAIFSAASQSAAVAPPVRPTAPAVTPQPVVVRPAVESVARTALPAAALVKPAAPTLKTANAVTGASQSRALPAPVRTTARRTPPPARATTTAPPRLLRAAYIRPRIHALRERQAEAAPPTVEINAAPAPLLVIEGDATVAEFDPLTGRIETREGKTFQLGGTHAAANAAPWEEFRSSLHYRCEQGGRCWLFRAGAISPNARLLSSREI